MTVKSRNESKLVLQMYDLTSESKRMLSLIKGYEKESLVTLERVVKPLVSFNPDVEEMVY